MDLLEKALATSSGHLICIYVQIPFFIGLVLNDSSLKKLNILRISKSQEWRIFNNNKPQTKFTGSYKKNYCISFFNNK